MTKFNFPNPSVVYVREDEAQFRAMVERALNVLAGEKQSDQPPSFEVQLRQNGTTATMTVRVRNPGNNWLGFVRWKKLGGPGDFDARDPDDGTWTTDSSMPFTATETIEPKHGAVIAFAAPWRDTAGALQWVLTEHRFDSDYDAELTGHEMAFDTNGVPVLSLTGDEDVAKHYVNVAIGDDIAGATPSDPTAGSNDGTLNSRQGRIRFDGADGDDKTTAMGQLVGYKVVCENGDGTVNSLVFGPYFKRRGDSQTVPPRVQVLGLRSGATVTITLTISDPTLAITAVEFRKQNSGGTLGSFVSGWDTSTGTAGVDEDLVRAEDVDSDPGLHARFIWRVTWTDENGDTQYIGDEIDLADLDEVHKTLRIGLGDATPASDAETWVSSGGIIRGNTAGSASKFVKVIPVPRGTELNTVRAQLYCGNGASAAQVEFVRYDDTTGLSVRATLAHSAAGTPSWEEDSSALSESTTDTATRDYAAYITLTPDTDAVNAQARYLDLDYLAPSYDVTY